MTTLIAVVSILVIGAGGLHLIYYWTHWPSLRFPWLAVVAIFLGIVSLFAVEVMEKGR